MIEILLIILCITAAKRFRAAGEKGVSKYIWGVWGSLLGAMIVGGVISGNINTAAGIVIMIIGYIIAISIAISAVKAGKGYMEYREKEKSTQMTNIQNSSLQTQSKNDANIASWSQSFNGGSRYYSQKARNLYTACEILKSLTSIPAQTYYIVDTPDGTLGRDMNGFFTESAIKTKNLKINEPCGETGLTQAQSLTGFGDMTQNHNAVAMLKMGGQYAKLVLMMKCGKCGYESPVETDAGDNERQCYNCGMNNTVHRGSINAFTPRGMVEL